MQGYRLEGFPGKVRGRGLSPLNLRPDAHLLNASRREELRCISELIIRCVQSLPEVEYWAGSFSKVIHA
jgi:hypothetical protein